jgi:hypothetical protein
LIINVISLIQTKRVKNQNAEIDRMADFGRNKEATTGGIEQISGFHPF